MKELIIIAGANGSGKTTFSKQILPEMGFDFLNADEIEKELTVSKLQAGKEFFIRLGKFLSEGTSFVLESTLSGNYLAKAIEKAKKQGYVVRIVYVFLENPHDCIQRIKVRVKLGGHFVPDGDVIRRYYRSKANFWNMYKNLASSWVMIYNSTDNAPQRVAIGKEEDFVVEIENVFQSFLKDLEKMGAQKLDSLEAYQTASYFTNLFSKAVQEAKEINRKNGLPNDFVVSGKRFYELPNGEIVTENPLADVSTKQ